MSCAWAEVDLHAVGSNVRAMLEVSDPAELCAVVKADGYGHGAAPVARAALGAGATWLAVAQVDEALVLREAGIDEPILLLSSPPVDELPAAVSADLRFTVYRRELVRALAEAATPLQPVRVHVKVDTGMHRVGASPEELVALARAVVAEPNLELEAVWTHCAVADDPGDPFTREQLRRYERCLEALDQAGVDVPIRHAANSAAAITEPAARYDLVRSGIALYGLPPSPQLDGVVALQPVLRLATQVSHVQRVRAGEGISYGLRYRPERDTVVATLPLGYADGVRRDLPTRGQEVLLGGKRLPMAGVVTMDQLMVDCGPDAEVAVGDEAVLIGEQGSEQITAQEWAQRLGTIGYEVVCGLGPRVERRYVGS